MWNPRHWQWIVGALLLFAACAHAQTARVIAVDKVGNKIRFYATDPLRETAVIDSPGKTVHELALSPDKTIAYIPLFGDGIYGNNKEPNKQILVVELKSGRIVATIDTGPYLAPHGLAVTPDGRLWATSDQPAPRLLLIDPHKRTVEAVYDVPAKGPHFIAATPDGAKLYVSNKEGPVAVFDTAQRRFTGSIAMAGGEGLAVSPDGKRMTIVDNGQSLLHVVDTTTDRIQERVPLTLNPPLNPKRTRLHKLAFSPDGRSLAVVNYASALVWLIDSADWHRQTVFAVAKGPQGIAFSPDGAQLLIASHDSGLITLIGVAERRITGAIDGGAGIEALAFF